MPLFNKLSVGAGLNAPDAPPGSPVDSHYEASLKHNLNLDILEARFKMRFIVRYPVVPTASLMITGFKVREPFTLRAGLDLCGAHASVGATGTTVFSYMRDAEVVGTATFASGGQAGEQDGVLATTGGLAYDFTVDTYFSIVAQVTPDTTIAGISFYTVGDWIFP